MLLLFPNNVSAVSSLAFSPPPETSLIFLSPGELLHSTNLLLNVLLLLMLLLLVGITPLLLLL